MFNLELGKVIAEIKKQESKQVLIQLPEGLKPRAEEIVNAIEQHTDADAFVWFGTCFGACDLPLGLNSLGVDLIVAFGHNPYHKTIQEW